LFVPLDIGGLLSLIYWRHCQHYIRDIVRNSYASPTVVRLDQSEWRLCGARAGERCGAKTCIAAQTALSALSQLRRLSSRPRWERARGIVHRRLSRGRWCCSPPQAFSVCCSGRMLATSISLASADGAIRRVPGNCAHHSGLSCPNPLSRGDDLSVSIQISAQRSLAC
jgi:hypothetical protein